MDRGAWQAIVHRVPRVRHDLATKLPQHSLSHWCSFPLLLTYWKLFIMNGCWVLSNGFLHLLIGSFLFFSLLQWWITLSNFLNVETTLFIWDKYPLIVVSNFFFTHCWVQFCWEFCTYDHDRHRSAAFLSCNVFVWLCNQGNSGLIEWVIKYSFCFYPLKDTVENWYNFFFKHLVEFISEYIWAWKFLFWKVINLLSQF